ncbi:LOW QUALITY PROTEIN: endothelial cell adhesion molecule a [Menidia menidia]
MGCSTWRKLTLLSFSILCLLSGTGANIQMPDSSMEVIKGQMVVLRASYLSDLIGDLNANIIVWNFFSNGTQLILTYNRGVTVSSPQFQGRVGFLSKMPSTDVSLYVNNTRESDSGRYVCQVIYADKPGVTAELTLDVKVPPAVPRCSLSGRPVLKGNVTLSCSSRGKPLPLYRWKKTSPTPEVFFSPMANERTGVLKLSNLSANMSGKYVCTASNSAGAESCDISLDISTSNRVGMIVGATVGSVLGFIFLLFVCLAFLVFFRRRRYGEDDMANEIKEDAQAPKRVSWAKSGMGSDVISKNGTLSSIGSSPRHKDPPHPPHHHHQYPPPPASDTASILTATGPPPRHQGACTPTHYSYNNSSTLPRGGGAMAANGGPPPPTGGQERYTQLPQAQAPPPQALYGHAHAHPQAAAPPPPPLPTATVTASNISRMGGVPIMVPAQNQAGSLV